MTGLDHFEEDLRAHLALCEEILALGSRTAEPGIEEEPAAVRKNLLAQLTHSLDKIREHRMGWLRLEPAEREGHPQITELLRENQNLIMRILMMDRENEKARLRKGAAPGRQPVRGEQPHFVSSLYRRNSYA